MCNVVDDLLAVVMNGICNNYNDLFCLMCNDCYELFPLMYQLLDIACRYNCY